MKFGALGKQLAVTQSYNPGKGGAVWFLHGTSDTGPGLKSWLHRILDRDFMFKNHKILYPTAPSRPYDLFDGKIAAVWHNRLKLSPEMPEDIHSIDKTATSLADLIKEETLMKGIPLSKVVVGGFSLGGSMALHLAYRLHPEVAGCFVLSSFLPPESKVYDNLKSMNNVAMDKNHTEGLKKARSSGKPQISISSPLQHGIPGEEKGDSFTTMIEDDTMDTKKNELKLPKLFMSCGTADPLVRSAWTKATFSKLREHGLEGHIYMVPKLDHSIHPMQLHLLHNWIDEVLGDKNGHSSDNSNYNETLNLHKMK